MLNSKTKIQFSEFKNSSQIVLKQKNVSLKIAQLFKKNHTRKLFDIKLYTIGLTWKKISKTQF